MNKEKDNIPENPNPDYKDRDILLKPVLLFMAGLAVLTVLVLFLMVGVFRVMDREAERRDVPDSPLVRERVLPPGPRLMVEEQQALEEYRADMREILENYAWHDPEAEQVRIPIDRAIDLLAERGLPVGEEAVSREEPEPDEAGEAANERQEEEP